MIVCNSRILCAGDAIQIDFLNEMERTFPDELIPAHLARGNDAYLVYASGEVWNTALQGLFLLVSSITAHDNFTRSLISLQT